MYIPFPLGYGMICFWFGLHRLWLNILRALDYIDRLHEQMSRMKWKYFYEYHYFCNLFVDKSVTKAAFHLRQTSRPSWLGLCNRVHDSCAVVAPRDAPVNSTSLRSPPTSTHCDLQGSLLLFLIGQSRCSVSFPFIGHFHTFQTEQRLAEAQLQSCLGRWQMDLRSPCLVCCSPLLFLVTR